MNSLNYSFQKDKLVWIFLVLSSILLFICELNIGISWPAWEESIRIVFTNIFNGIIVSCIFFLLCSSIFQYRKVRWHLELLCNNLLSIQSNLKEIEYYFLTSLSLYSEDKGCSIVTEVGKRNLEYCCQSYKKDVDSITCMIELIPAMLQERLISQINKTALKRLYFNQFNDCFSKSQIHSFKESVDSAIDELNEIHNSLSKLIKK